MKKRLYFPPSEAIREKKGRYGGSPEIPLAKQCEKKHRQNSLGGNTGKKEEGTEQVH